MLLDRKTCHEGSEGPIALADFSPALFPRAGRDDVARAVRLLQRASGIVLGAHKQDMTARTLGVRTREVGLTAVRDYLEWLERERPAGEWEHFINAFTINHTAFFRERHHFRILADFARSRGRPVSVWCCAASTGEEPYSLAMTLHDACGGFGADSSILATDIDTHALAHARTAVYPMERVKPVPPDYLRRYFLRGAGAQAGMARVKPFVRDRVSFGMVNLVAGNWPAGRTFDAIFCRNTLIYFDQRTQIRILERFIPMLKSGGLLFVGHSENFTYLTGKLRLLGQTVYRVA